MVLPEIIQFSKIFFFSLVFIEYSRLQLFIFVALFSQPKLFPIFPIFFRADFNEIVSFPDFFLSSAGIFSLLSISLFSFSTLLEGKKNVLTDLKA